MHDSLVGTVVDGRYAIAALIGRGGMATVYRARDKRLERDIALKLMHPHLAEKSDLNTRFNKEARAAAQFSNPHVVAIHDQGVWTSPDGPRAYLIMEYVPGPDLRSELRRLGSLSLGNCLDITEQILRALAAAHNTGIVHRDVKPENILLTNSLPYDAFDNKTVVQAKVADFGLAHVMDMDYVATGTVLGTVAYIPPESVGSGIFEPPADLYSLGIMMYEAITGQLPFKGETPMQTAYMHITKPMPKIADTAEWIPAQVDSFIASLTAKEPGNRPAHGKEALAQFLAMRKSLDEGTLNRRIPVLPTALPKSAEEVAEEPYQEKTVAYAQAPELLLSLSEPSAVSEFSAVSDQYKGSSLIIEETSTPTSTLSAAEIANYSHPATQVSTLTKPDSTSDAPDTPKSGRFKQLWEKFSSHMNTPRGRRLAIILLTILIALTAVLSWYFFVGPGKRVAIPEVAGMTADKGEQTLVAAGFVVERKEAYSDDVPEGLVISTDPSDTHLRIGSTVTLIVSLGIEQVEVPKVVSLTRSEALAKLSEARLRPKVTESYSDDVKKGRVISQSLKAGELVNHDSTIKIVISKGREPVDVPNLTDMNLDAAVKALEDAGLKAEVKEEFSETVPKGTVMSQDPSDGTVYRGDTISLTVSKGPPTVEVPDVIDMFKKPARSKLEAAGFQVNVEKGLNLFGIHPKGKVYDQDPSPGETVPAGSTITIWHY